MGKNKNKKKQKAERVVKGEDHISAENTAFPLPFPSHLRRPSGDFLRDEDPFKESFQTALSTSYEGFVVDETTNHSESKVTECLNEMLEKDIFRTDVTQPFGLGTKCAKTYVTRCLLGEAGTTYKYLGLRMFAHTWENSEIYRLSQTLTQRTKHHLSQLDNIRGQRGAPKTRGRPDYDICLINRMESTKDLKTEPSLGSSKTSVSWHADSSLEHYSTIAVYQTLITPKTSKKNKKEKDFTKGSWSVALRVAHDSEGPKSSRRGTDIESSIIKNTPPIAASLPSGSTYFLLDDFNHHHQHTVLTNGDSTSAGVRYSCTYRLLRESHNVEHIISRCRTACSNFHKKGSKLWRSEQLLLSEVESEWIRQFFIQGSQHHDLLWPYWKRPIEQLLQYWGQLEKRTKQTIDFLQLAAEGRCDNSKSQNKSDTAPPPKSQRKVKERRKKALDALEDLLQRTSSGDQNDALTTIYEPFAELIEERAKMRELWEKREKDHVFHEMGEECRPMTLPFKFGEPMDAKQVDGHGLSSMSGKPSQLHTIASTLRAYGKAFDSGNSSDLPEKEEKEERKNDNHSKSLDWAGWNDSCFGLELQEPWAGAILDGSKEIETRLYDLPKSLLNKRIIIIQSPKGSAGVSSMGNVIEFSKSKARPIGWCVFTSVKEYTTKKEFVKDEHRHLVTADSGYGWKDGTKIVYGWVVGKYGRFNDENDFSVAIRRMRSLFQIKSNESSPTKKAEKKRRQNDSGRGDGTKKKKRKRRF